MWRPGRHKAPQAFQSGIGRHWAPQAAQGATRQHKAPQVILVKMAQPPPDQFWCFSSVLIVESGSEMKPWAPVPSVLLVEPGSEMKSWAPVPRASQGATRRHRAPQGGTWRHKAAQGQGATNGSQKLPTESIKSDTDIYPCQVDAHHGRITPLEVTCSSTTNKLDTIRYMLFQEWSSTGGH